MKNIKLVIMILVVAAFLAALAVQAESNKQTTASVQTKEKAEPAPAAAAVSAIEVRQTTPPQSAPLASSSLGYKLVTDALDGFAGASESDNYRIPVNSGGQPSAIGISASDNYLAKAGFVHASHVIHGDANGDVDIGAGDIVYLLNYLYRSDDPPCPMESGDANCDGGVGPGDIVYLLNYLYRSGPSPSC